MKIREGLGILKQMYKNKKYFYITFISAIVLFIVFYKLMLEKIANHNLKIFIMMSGFYNTYYNFVDIFFTW